MDTNQKLELLNMHLTSLSLHVVSLETDISLNPTSDVDGKPTRSSVLLEYAEKKAIIENMIATLKEEENL